MSPDIDEMLDVCDRIARNVLIYLPVWMDVAKFVQRIEQLNSIAKYVDFIYFYSGDQVRVIACFIGDLVRQNNN